MDLYILSQNFETISVIDSYHSLIWTERFSEHGDFELTMSSDAETLDVLMADNYITHPTASYPMIIEDLSLNYDHEHGYLVKLSGRAPTSILERRVIKTYTGLDGSVGDCINVIMQQNLISPDDPLRKIDNFEFEVPTDPRITNAALEPLKFHGETLYDAIKDICAIVGIGFEVVCPSDGHFLLRLYAGTNRSYMQNDNLQVVFSPEFENLLTSDYAQTYREAKTVAYVGDSGEGNQRRVVQADWGGSGGSGLARREMFVSSSGGGGQDPEEVIISRMRNDGLRELYDKRPLAAFEGEASPHGQWVFGRDFEVGDIVQYANGPNMQAVVRISEYVISVNSEGLKEYPVFSIL